MQPPHMQIAIIGDIHESWSEADTAYFNAQPDLCALLCVGDLPGRTRHANALKVAQMLAKLRLPALLIPGNHDATSFTRMVAEIIGLPTKGGIESQRDRVRALAQALDPVEVVGYSLHAIQDPTGQAVSVIAARPHAMGDGLSFAPYLEAAFGIKTLAESAARLKALVDAAPHSRLVFLAHNGPSGLGAEQQDMWGCDFKRGGGDWGDPDLREAIDYAQRQGREVLAVIAGHMHHRTRQGAIRPWQRVLGGVLYVNAARCPRIFSLHGRTVHHHIRLHLPPEAPCYAEEHLISQG